MRVLTACLLCLISLSATAEIYKYTDAKGNTVFTNQPPEGKNVETVKLPPTNTVQPPSSASHATGSGSESSGMIPAQAYRVLQLSNIPNDEALRVNNGTFVVQVDIQPDLQPGHSLQLLLDGKPYGAPSASTQLQVSTADRGEHSLAVEVRQGSQPVQQSPTVTFTLQRTSVNAPARRAN
ncbi:DUF4124 domain-containing protein [Pseudomonas sp. LRF_L74]|uniref:DUF4124 domain-containing protein n=1 Tax=Pseudomonas sp. LRF_L74 TaxID=3369422 RepID=UPI003F6010F9